MSKSIYTFTIPKVTKVSEKRTETYKDESGKEKERTITEEIEKQVDIEVLVKKPNRRQMQEAEMVFSIEMSRCIKSGILTKAMLMNKYADNGGLVNSEDNEILDAAYSDLNKLNLELTEMISKPKEERDEEEEKDILRKQKEIISLRKGIVESEACYLNLFNHTADTKAQNKIVLWYVLNLSYYKDPSLGHEDFVPIFDGVTFEEKEEKLFELEEGEDDLYGKIYSKLASVLSFWYFSGGEINLEEFDKMIQEKNA